MTEKEKMISGKLYDSFLDGLLSTNQSVFPLTVREYFTQENYNLSTELAQHGIYTALVTGSGENYSTVPLSKEEKKMIRL